MVLLETNVGLEYGSPGNFTVSEALRPALLNRHFTKMLGSPWNSIAFGASHPCCSYNEMTHGKFCICLGMFRIRRHRFGEGVGGGGGGPLVIESF